MNIILVGAPGAGKGTISTFLKREYQIPYLSTGDVFRAEIQKRTELGLLAKQLIDQGNFIPDDITIRMVKKALSEMKEGFLLDGFPRNLPQVHAFETFLQETGMQLDLVLHLDVNDSIILNRLMHRQVCPSCQATYHKIDIPPKREGLCDYCRSNLITREDDKPEHIENRLNIYHSTTKPIITYYKERGLLSSIKVDCSVQELYDRVQVVLKKERLIGGEQC
ncbi:adenylate kinase [Brevibacillus sp. NPDC058079]|uniref:adenylate kinase n=1 Tax=Brevibacillus sp. NPDC058079 TaxID=3346330 RepID=UPI0036EE5AE8